MFGPPPGQNVPFINRQNNYLLPLAGAQGLSAQGYGANPFSSNYATPSSYAPASSQPIQNAQYSQMAKALMR